jgi:hypothetical protein
MSPVSMSRSARREQASARPLACPWTTHGCLPGVQASVQVRPPHHRSDSARRITGATKRRTIASTLRSQYSAASFPALAPGVLHPPDPLPRPGTPTTGALARPQHCGIRLFIDQGPASPAWRRVSSLRCGPRRRDRRVNCSIELAELVGQELPLVLKAAVAGVGGCQPGSDVKAGLVGGTGPRQGSQRPRRGRRVVRSC